MSVEHLDIENLYEREIEILKNVDHPEYESIRAFLENELFFSHSKDYTAIKNILGEKLQEEGKLDNEVKLVQDDVGALLAQQEID